MKNNNNAMETEIAEAQTHQEITETSNKDENTPLLPSAEATPNRMRKILAVFEGLKNQCAKIECKKLGDKILQIKIKKPSQRQVIILLLCLPGLLDSIGYGILSFSQLLTASFSLELLEENTNLIQPNYLTPLMILPSFATIGALVLAIHENIQNIKPEFVLSIANFQDKLKDAKEMLLDSPLITICLLAGSITEAIIIYSNLESLVEQLGIQFYEEYYNYAGLILVTNIALQYVILNGPHLNQLVKKGYTTQHDYLINQKSFFAKVGIFTIVNTLPILGSLTAYALATSESYELSHRFVGYFETNDNITDRIAWLPAVFVFGIFYFWCNLALYACGFKDFMAEKFELINSSDPNNPDQTRWRKLINELTPNSEKWILKSIIYPMVLFISLSNFFIGFAALDAMTYIVVNSEPQALESSVLSFSNQLIYFTPPSACLALGIYAVEGRRLLAMAGLAKEITRTKAESKADSDGLKKLLLALISVFGIGIIKFLIDWVYMPDSVPANQVTFTDNLLVAGILGIVAMGRHGVASHYRFLSNKEVKVGIQECDNQSIDTPQTRKQFTAELLFIGLLTMWLTTGIEVLIRYVLLDPSKSNDMDRLNNAQTLAALSGGIIATYSLTAVQSTYRAGKQAWGNCCNHFKSQNKSSGNSIETSEVGHEIPKRVQYEK